MAQHFLLSSAARSLSLKEIYKAGEQVAYETFCNIRWASTGGEAVCPKCGCCETYNITTRRKFKCKGCHHQFSVTSGTIFASRKLDFVDLLAAICLFVTNSKGMSAVQFSRTLSVQYKTAWVMAHKLREAFGSETDNTELDGEVEIDGAYFGGHIKPANEKTNRIDRRKAENQTGLRRVVIALRERHGRTLPFVGKSEAEGVKIAHAVVEHGSMMFADEASHWDLLDTTFECGRINHSKRYSEMNGKHTNWVESYFSRLRRMVSGQHHFVSPKYLHQYATHAAWLEDHRMDCAKVLVERVLQNGLFSPVSREFKGYWQKAN
mgnify:CR=1 FL=1